MLGFDAIASLPLSSIPAQGGNVTVDGDAASLVFTGQSGTVSLSVSGDAASLVFTGQDGTVTVSGGTQPSGGYRWHGHETFEEWQRRIRKVDDAAREAEAQAEAELDKLQVQRADMLQARADRVGKLTAAQQKRAAWLDMQISLAIAKINAAKQAQADAAHAFDMAVQQDYQRKRRNANAIRAFLMMV